MLHARHLTDATILNQLLFEGVRPMNIAGVLIFAFGGLAFLGKRWAYALFVTAQSGVHTGPHRLSTTVAAL
jgi:hypothetical protein